MSCRVVHPSRPHSDGGQLERHLAGVGRHVESQRLDDQGGHRYSSLWSEDFSDGFFQKGLRQWLNAGLLAHDQSHVRDFARVKLPPAEEKLGRAFGRQFKERKAIMGVFDEGCMGMFNAIIPDELLHPTGLFKERLSQSALFAAMRQVTDAEARAVLQWYLKKGVQFKWGKNEETELTRAQTSNNAKCTSPRCASPMISAAPPSASSISRV
jgi:hypothetical protein